MVLPISTSTAPRPNGLDFLDEYAGHIETLYETGSRPLTSVGGTANAVTATMAIDLTAAGYVDGLCVSITWAAANTAGVTLAINGGAAVPVVDARGTALVTGTLAAGMVSLLRYTAGQWRIISAFGADTDTGGPTVETFTAAGTWVKPSNYDPDTMVMVEIWGGGGAGGVASSSAASGGGGGAYNMRRFRIADLPGSVAITIGAGGVAPGGVGGTSTFGIFLSAFGGGGGVGVASGNPVGGGGGGIFAAGVTGGGAGDISGLPHSGGSGGGGSTAVSRNGQNSAWGGGGGGSFGSWGTTSGGASVFGGAGGGSASSGAAGSGVAPGGGGGGVAAGGTAGNGARGECRITIFG